MARTVNHSTTRQHIMRAAVKSFAQCGYVAASVRQIVRNARAARPGRYCCFAGKAQVFDALVDNRAHDEVCRLMQAATERGRTAAEKLEQIAAAVLELSLRSCGCRQPPP